MTTLIHRLTVAALCCLAGSARAQDASTSPAVPTSEASAKETVPHPETPSVKEPSAACTTTQECVERLGYGNVCSDGQCKAYADRTDLMDLFKKGPAKEEMPVAYRLYPAILPAIGYSPALGFLIGVYTKLGMYLGSPSDTTISSAQVILLLTTKKQLVLQIGTDVLTARNEWEFLGDWRFLLYNQDTYGLSTGTAVVASSFSLSGWGTTTAIPGAQPMKFDLLRIHQAVLRKVWGDLYLGGGYRLDRYFAIVDESLNLTAPSPTITSHYAYSVYYGFNPAEYTVSGVTLNALYDSRDSTINAYRGYFARVGFGVFPTWLGSSKASTELGADIRVFVPLSEEVPRNVLAFWFLVSGVTSGVQPYLALSATGWDAASTSGRGYIQGRFRGPWGLYGEVEWRFRITNNGLLGGTVFLNAETYTRPAFQYQTVSEPAVNLFQYIKPAGGIGLRIMMTKETRTNIRVDFAVGVDSFTVYFGAGEAF